jgi:Transposase
VETLVERCAGLDVHKDSVTACVRVPDGHGGRHAETRRFTTTTAGLVLWAQWLASLGVTRVGMESTGCYWKPVWQLLEDPGGVLAAERSPPAQRPWAEDRCGRRGLDRPAGGARAGPPQLRGRPARSGSCAS